MCFEEVIAAARDGEIFWGSIEDVVEDVDAELGGETQERCRTAVGCHFARGGLVERCGVGAQLEDLILGASKM